MVDFHCMAWHCLQQSTRWRIEQWRSRRPPLFAHARSIIGASGEDGIAVGAAVNSGKVLVMVCIGNNGMELVAAENGGKVFVRIANVGGIALVGVAFSIAMDH